MENFKPLKPSRGRAALLVTACLVAPLMAAGPKGAAGTAAGEASRRNAAVMEAQELLAKGDESYEKGRYDEAVQAYSGARELIPDAPVTAELRAAATERYAQASVEYARLLSRKGDVAGAKAAVDKVLAPSVAPENPGAVAFRAQLDDPIRTNPALTKEHAANVDAVRRELYTAEGAYNLGDLDLASKGYNKVLRIDPTNSAARRGLEKVAGAKSDYHKSASDHSRAEMLAQVDSQWELHVPDPSFDVRTITEGGESPSLSGRVSVTKKLDRIMIPKFALSDATLEEALDFLRGKAVENDTTELDPTLKGVNFTLNLGDEGSPDAARVRSQRFNLQLNQLPLSQALKYITGLTQTAYTTDDFSVIISPLGSNSTELVTRTYRVPPDFESSMGSGSASGNGSDPFAEGTGGAGILATRLGIKEALAQQGVTFPDGAIATLTNGNLRVVNTPTNQDFISQIVDAVTQTEPALVSVTITMIKTEQINLEELGFDWLLDNYGFGGNSWIPGQNELNLGGGTVGNGDSLSDIATPGNQSPRNPITAGNRSGDSAFTDDSITGLINDQQGRQVLTNRAPGVVSGTWIVNDATVQTLMRGLNQKKGVDLMAQPSVVSRSGQTSSIEVVREFLYPTEYEPPELPNSVGDTEGGTTPVTPATPTAFATRNIGMTLSVLPVIDPSKKLVNVTLKPEFSDFDGFVNYGSPINSTRQGLLGSETVQLTDNSILQPIFSVSRLSNNVDVADGATLVIGGMLKSSVENFSDKTPILGSIPIIGRFFQSQGKKSTSTAIIFLVKVEVMDPTGRPFSSR